MDVATFRALLDDPGQRLLARAVQLLAEGVDPLAAGSALRRDPEAGTAPSLAAAAMAQADLRLRARRKFGDLAASMYFTAEGLEQSTRRRVAEHRAARLAAAATPSVVDLTCGIGGDLVALARQGLTVAGVDLDPLRAEVAAANLRALGLGGAVAQEDATRLDRSVFGVAVLDPARRSARGRTFRVDAWDPPWDFTLAVLGTPSVVKVAPGVDHDLVPPGVEAEWVSDDGELKEAALWSPHLATARRRATVLADGGLATLTEADLPAHPVPDGVVGDYLYEPDPAVVRAGLVQAVAAALDAGLLDPHIAYVTTQKRVATPFARGYEVLERLPYAEKPLRAALRERGVGRLTIKKRGVDVVPEQLRRRLDLRREATGEATLVMTRVGGRGAALLVRPVT